MNKTLLFIFCFVTVALQAQQFRYGFSIAPGKTILNLEGDIYDPAVKFSDFQYGFIFDQTIGKGEHIAITAALNLNYAQSGMSITNSNGAGDDKIWEVRAQYFEVPLSLRLRTGQIGKFVFYGDGGASYATALRARGDYTLNGLRLDSDIDYLTKDNPNGISYTSKNASLTFGFGTEFSVTETASIMIGFFYEKGLMNVYEDNSEDFDIFLNQSGIRIAGLF